ncbi:MAG: hypothetical protein LAO24_10595 [Acidobacteriia bacterium]|nr:hypothetical protein [Terriglobia bacterium]
MKWEPLADGFEVLRFWKVVPPQKEEPQIAVLRLSGQKYGELQKAPKDFINRFKVFDKQVSSMELQAEPVAAGMAIAPQLVVVIHRPSCAAFGAAGVDAALTKAA